MKNKVRSISYIQPHDIHSGTQLKQKIAEDTSIDMDNQVLFTFKGNKITKLSLPLSNYEDIFICHDNNGNEQKYNNDNNENLNNNTINHNNNKQYTLSTNIPHIFIFDKHHGEHPTISSEYVLDPNDYMIDEEKLSSSPPPNLTSDEKLKDHPLLKHGNKSILWQTLPKYEIEFDYHYNLAVMIQDECNKKHSVAKKYIQQIQWQYQSLKSLEKYFKQAKEKLNKQQNKFINKCDEQITNHQEYLNDFESDLTKVMSFSIRYLYTYFILILALKILITNCVITFLCHS